MSLSNNKLCFYLLLMKFRAIGPHWNRIAQYFPKRSVNSIRNRVVRLLKNFGNHASHHLFGNFYNCQISPLNNLNQNNSHNCFYPNYTLNQHQFNNQMFYNHYQMMQNQQPTFTPQQIYTNCNQIPANSFPSPQCTSESETETATSSEESESDTVEEISTKLKADEFAELFSGIAFDDFDTSVGCNLF
ncbi:hypothetical protein TRFO_12050 [Tritrichomonas foetus]|uniref:Myb-like domain-containing protein n=1 Tax=Tritrichomonas foetus TaxID=1144522 RepID=A0A1J4J6I4_9EUKA|nr:hypothetical protein TRFO_12050 [Tritrichomonas foetus]|eukprot:OHS93045.1 hypothetical protein TRFO_12050 [Tritrichomonas foetus]